MIPALLRRTAAHLVAAVCCCAASAALAQDPATPDLSALGNRFARATIREHQQGPYAATFIDTEGNLIANGASLVSLIVRAYGMREFQIVDGPEWIHTPRLYDIEAVPPPAELVQSDATQMLRAFLADRFKLELLETSREMPVLALEFVETSAVLRKAETPELQWAPGAKEGLLLRTSDSPAGPRYLYAELTLSAMASSLSRELDTNVVDMTGLEGIWSLELHNVTTRARSGVEFAPLLEQLGLRLTERTVALDVLAVTHVEYPQLDE